MDSDKVFLCHQCGKIFCRLSTLESHTKWKHMDKPNEFMCHQCGRTFQKRSNLVKHLASGVHDVLESVKCAKCDFRAMNRKLMGEHYRNFHQLSLKETNVYFKSADEFYHWKSEFENKTRSRFVKMSCSRRRKDGGTRSTYFCHRDGNFIPKGRNLRHIKLKGSNKINAHCPAKMEVDIGEKMVIASYIDTHLGHELDVSRITLAHEYRSLIAKKLSMQVSFEEILNEINRSENSNKQKHVKFITRKDLWNIVDAFKINPKTVVHKKSRVKKKKKLERPKKEAKWNHVHFRISRNNNCKPIFSGKKTVCKVGSNETYIVNNVNVSVGQEDEDNLVFCPFIVKDESELFQEYALIVDNKEVDTSSCLIINSKEELQRVVGHQVIYTHQGEIEINDTVEYENEILSKEESNISANKTSTNSDMFYNHTLKENSEASHCKVSFFEQHIDEGEAFRIKTNNVFGNLKAKQTKNLSTYSLQSTNKNSSEFITVKQNFNVNYSHKSTNTSDNIIELPEDNNQLEDSFNSMCVEYLNKRGSPPCVKEVCLEDQSEYEGTVGNLNSIKEEYVMSPTKDELDYAVTPNNDTQHSFDSASCTVIPFELLTVKTIKEETPEEEGLVEEVTFDDTTFVQVCESIKSE